MVMRSRGHAADGRRPAFRRQIAQQARPHRSACGGFCGPGLASSGPRLWARNSPKMWGLAGTGCTRLQCCPHRRLNCGTGVQRHPIPRHRLDPDLTLSRKRRRAGRSGSRSPAAYARTGSAHRQRCRGSPGCRSPISPCRDRPGCRAQELDPHHFPSPRACETLPSGEGREGV